MALIRPALPQLAFTMIPNAWARDGNLRPNAKAVLMSLLSHAEGYRLTTAQIMRETGLGRDGVDAAVDHMLARGYLVSVQQRQGENGRFGENDYTVTDCTDRTPPIPSDPPKRGRKVRNGPQRSETAPVLPGTGPAVDGYDPPIEEQGEETTPAPTEQAGDGRHLRAVNGSSLNQRANALTREHYDASHGMVPFAGVLQIVRRALDRGGYDDDRVRKALGMLRDAGRPVTLQTLHAALESPETVAPRRYGPRAQISGDPDDHRGAF